MLPLTPQTPRLAALLIAGLALAGTLPAQRFTFEHKKMIATPGETVEVRVFLGDSPVNVAGANFTVRVSEADSARARLLDATSTSPLASVFFNYADNRLARTDVSTGAIQGDVVELRGALYSTRKPPLGFAAGASPAHIATVLIPIDITARGRVLLELAEGGDNGVALLGVSDVSGNPVAPDGQTTPHGDFAVIVINAGNEPVVTDLREPAQQAGWVYTTGLPAPPDPLPVGVPVAGEGLRTRFHSDFSFSTWNWDFARLGPWQSPPAGRLFVSDWTFTSDTATPVEVPPIRLRTMTGNHVLSSELLIQRLVGNTGPAIVPTPAGRTYRTIMEIPTFAADGFSDDGLNSYFDLFAFEGLGKPGKAVTLRSLTERVIDPATLTGRTTEYAQTFDNRVDGGWRFAGPSIGGREVEYSRSRYGLGITSGGPFRQFENGTFDFSFGYWHSPEGPNGLKANSAKWYKVEMMVHGTADNPVWNPQARLRVYAPGDEFYAMLLFAPVLDIDDHHLPRINLEGVALTSWFTTPPELDNKPLNIAFDMVHLDAPAGTTDQKPSLFLKWIRVTSYDSPLASP